MHISSLISVSELTAITLGIPLFKKILAIFSEWQAATNTSLVWKSVLFEINVFNSVSVNSLLIPKS